MQDAALFYRSRAVSSFHRRRLHPILSDEWRHSVGEARMFIRACRSTWDDRPREIRRTVYALGPRVRSQGQSTPEERFSAMMVIAKRAAQRPVFDPRRPDEIIGNSYADP